MLGSDLLGDEAAERKAQQIDLGEAKQADEVDRVSRHRRDIVGRLTGRAPDTGVVEGDDRTISSKCVDDGGIPRVNISREMLQEHQRRSGRGAEAAIGEADSSTFDVSGGRRFQRVVVPARYVEFSYVILRMLGVK